MLENVGACGMKVYYCVMTMIEKLTMIGPIKNFQVSSTKGKPFSSFTSKIM